MNIEELKVTEISGSDVILSVDHASIESMAELRDVLIQLWPEKKFLIIDANQVEQINEAEMNRLGRYRKDGYHE